jgi:hypothetical protein
MEIIKQILTDEINRDNLIRTLQEQVWNGEFDHLPDEMIELMYDLAYDLDFYEPNPIWRSEDPSYYGEERLVEIVSESIQKIEAIGIAHSNAKDEVS